MTLIEISLILSESKPYNMTTVAKFLNKILWWTGSFYSSMIPEQITLSMFQITNYSDLFFSESSIHCSSMTSEADLIHFTRLEKRNFLFCVTVLGRVTLLE